MIVEQPIAEAYAVATQLERQLLITIMLALLIMVSLGYAFGRSFITPIATLIRATQAVAQGRLDARVPVTGKDEIGRLGDAFNSMADQLDALQEDLKKKERHAMFGRIAAGLVHDLSHPIQNIGNNCKLILKMFDDRDYRETFRRTVDRELAAIKRVFEDLQNIARPIPLEHFPVDVNKSIADIVEAMRPSARHAMLELQSSLSDQPLHISGDLFALSRVYRNLLLNALQATAPQGRVSISSELRGDQVWIAVSDTGCGIPPDRLATIFEDFVTTKRRGLGLGLAITRKIVEQLGGTIAAESEVNKGTTFVLRFPAIDAPVQEQVGPLVGSETVTSDG
jgi:two-component system sensor histidine kinase AtoS